MAVYVTGNTWPRLEFVEFSLNVDVLVSVFHDILQALSASIGNPCSITFSKTV
jgi:hypothetical protein